MPQGQLISSAHSASPEEEGVPGIGQLSAALEELDRTVCSLKVTEARRNDDDLVGVLGDLHVGALTDTCPKGSTKPLA